VKVLFLSLFVLGTLSSCNALNLLSPARQTEVSLPQAEVVFQVHLPAALPANTTLNIEFLDDVTGLALNPTRYEMAQQDDLTYFVKIPLVIGSVVKYRYVRQSDVSTVEYTPQGTQVRYRLASIIGPAILQDNVAAWIDQPYSGPMGRVRGQFIDKNSNAPVPNLMVSAEGIQTVTASDGTFILQGLTPGTHNIVTYSLDGQFKSFSQGVTIAENATTPVFVYLEKRNLVTVTFNLTAPNDFDARYPVRFASNSESLGNVYADLYSGSTTVAANLPMLTKISTGHYQLRLQLPAGYDLHYKYTLGDGLWNSELNSAGGFAVRELIVPASDTTINDVVSTFTSPNFGPITFNVAVPANTPADEVVSLQLNPFGWFGSIPMVRVADNLWSYTLYSPLSLFGETEFRFCRNDACDLSQAVAQSDQKFTPNAQPQDFSLAVQQWANFTPPAAPTVVTTDGGSISPRPDFTAAYEVTDSYLPIWSAYLQDGLTKMANTGASAVVLTPTFTATRNNLPYLEPVPGADISWPEMQTTIIKAEQTNLNVVLFPRVNFPEGAPDYWSAAQRDDGWWTSWFEQYHRYMMQVADWAALTGVKTIVVGDPMLSPAMTNGKLANGDSSGAPADADAQWRQLIQDMRARFGGTVLGAVAYPSVDSSLPGWLDAVDGIYVLYSPALAQTSSATVADLETLFQQDLEKSLNPKLANLNKPVWLSLNYPSSGNAFAGCTDTLGSCLDEWGSGPIDLNTQANIYNAAFIVAAKESWITGFVARGTQPIVAVMDGSTSILAKPANDVLWFWYHFILNKTP